MLNIDYIRQHPDNVREGLRQRQDTQNLDELLRLAEQRRGLVTRCNGLYTALKRLKDSQRTVPLEKRAELSEKTKAMSRDIRQLELQVADIDTHLQPMLLSIPNIPHTSVHDGTGKDDRELRRWGEPLTFQY